jgi:hypothetical protein
VNRATGVAVGVAGSRAGTRWAALLLLLAVCAPGCGQDAGQGDGRDVSTNLAPTTNIVNPTLRGEGASYNLLVSWSAYDEDGSISGFEIALDDTAGAWTFTTAYDSVFVFESANCCVPDTTIFPDGSVRIDSLYRDSHTLFVRAIDNEGTEDPTPERTSFTSTTITPETVILRGPKDFTVTAKTVIFEWEGRDRDGEIAGYQYRLISGPGYLEIPTLPTGIADSAWTYVPADCTLIRLTNLSTSSGTGSDQRGKHRFAVVAVDNAGAVERTMDDIVNTRDWESVETIGGSLVITSNVMGSRTGINTFEGQVFEGARLSFDWRGDAALYGGEIQCYSYAFDQRETFSGCDLRSTHYPPGARDFIPSLGSHTLFVRAFDDAGQTIEANFTFVVLRIPPADDRRILLVDDFNDGDGGGGRSLPEDPTEDAFWDSILADQRYTPFNVDNDNDLPSGRVLANATTVIWYVDVESNALTTSNLATAFRNALGPYVSAGGNLILCGTQATNAFTPDNSWDPATVDLLGCAHGREGKETYGPVPWLPGWSLDWFPAFCDSSEHFVHDFFKIRRSFYHPTDDQLDSLVATGVALPGGALLPTLGVDWSKQAPGYLNERFGLQDCEHYELREFDAQGGRIAYPLWTHLAVDGTQRGIAGVFVPADAARGRGHVIVLGFPPFFFDTIEMQEVFRTLLGLCGEVPVS